MATTVSLNWNEVLIARKHAGTVTCWTAWRRDISAFTDPAVWRDPAAWPTYFTQQPKDAGWGFEGYGLIAVDMDAKKVYSANDYMVPGTVYFPSDSLAYNDPELAHRSLCRLLDQPDAWPHVTIQMAKTRLLPGTHPTVERRLSEILPVGVSAAHAFELLHVQRGLLHVTKQKWQVFSVEYRPSDWEVHTDRGQEEPSFTLHVLRALMSTGFPEPDWDNVTARVLRDDCEYEAAPDDETDDGYRSAEIALSALKEQWVEKTAMTYGGFDLS